MKDLPRRPVTILGCPMDLGAGRRGTDMGPSAVRLAGLHKHLARAGFTDVEDLGDMEVPAVYRITRICAADSSPSGARDAALLSLLRGSSLRRAEAVALDLADYDAGAGTIEVRGVPRGNALCIAVPASSRRALERWIRIRGTGAGPLFNPVNKGGRIERRRLSEQAIYIACQKRASEAGLPPTSPENLRRVWAEP